MDVIEHLAKHRETPDEFRMAITDLYYAGAIVKVGMLMNGPNIIAGTKKRPIIHRTWFAHPLWAGPTGYQTTCTQVALPSAVIETDLPINCKNCIRMMELVAKDGRVGNLPAYKKSRVASFTKLGPGLAEKPSKHGLYNFKYENK